MNVESRAPVRRYVSSAQQEETDRNDTRDLGRAVKQGHQARFEAGYSPTGRTPYGYVYPPRWPGERVNFVPDPEAARVVARLFEAYTTEGFGFREIVYLAVQLGYKPRKGQMSVATARKILTNPVYAGWVRHAGVIRKGTHHPIVSQSVFDAAQARIASRPRGAQ